jgi:hypothetical protein
VFCPVADHKQLGMNLELTVTPGQAKASAPTAKPVKKSSPTKASSGGGSGY